MPTLDSSSPVNSTIVAKISADVTGLPSALDSANDELFLPGENSLSIIAGTNNTVVATVPVGENLNAPTYDPANLDLYVPEVPDLTGGIPGHENLSVVSGSTDRLLTTIPLPEGPYVASSPAAYDPGNGNVYVPLYGSPGNVSVISGATNTVVATVPVGGDPLTPLYDASNGNVYVANTGSDNVTVISGATNTVVATIPLDTVSGTYPDAPIFDSASQNLYIPILGANGHEVSVVSTTSNSVLATIPTGRLLGTPVFDSLNEDLYAVTPNNVTVIDGATNAVVATIPVKGISTYPPAFDAGNGALYFPNIDLGGISIVSGGTNTLVGNLTLGEPSDTILGGPTYDPRNGEVYAPAIIVGESTGTVFVIGNGSASSAPVPTGLPWVVFGAGLGGAAVAAGLVVTYRRRQAPTKGEPR